LFHHLLSPGEGAKDGGDIMELMPWRQFGTLGSMRKGLDSLLSFFS